MPSLLPIILLSFTTSLSSECKQESIKFFWVNDDSSYYNVAIYNEHKLEKATPLIFLHGFLGTRHVWDITRDYLLEQYHEKMKNHPMIMISYRGHGDSIIYDTDKIQWTIQDIADEVFDLIVNKLNINTQFVLVGHCYGGSLATLIGLLVLVGSSAFFSPEIASGYKAHCSPEFISSLGGKLEWCRYSIDDVFRLKDRLDLGYLTKEDYDFHLVEACQVTSDAAQYILPDYMDNWDITQDGMSALKNTNIPILFVAGTQDSLFPMYKPFVDLLSQQQLRFVEIVNADRYLFIEQEFVSILGDELFDFIS